MLTPGERLLLRLACGAMFLSCFQAWSDVVFASIHHGPVTLPQAATLLAAAALVQALHHRRGWRRVTIIGLHGFAFAAFFMWLVGRHFSSAPACWRLTQWPVFFAAGHSATEWGVLFLLLACAGGLWFCGRRLVARPPEPQTVSRRFDAGLAYLLLLLVIELVVAVKGATVPGEPSAIRAVIAFFVLGLFSMGLARIGGSESGQGVAFVKGIGAVFSFAAVTLLLGGGLFVLFMPELKTAAQTSLAVLGTAAEPLKHLLVAVVRLWLGPSRALRAGADPASAPHMPAPGEEGGFLGWIISWILAVPVLAIALAAAAGGLFLMLRWLVRRLFARSPKSADGPDFGRWLASLAAALARWLSDWRQGFCRWRDPSAAARHCYLGLLRWGRVTGLLRAATETPAEYGLRLKKHFPQVEGQIDLLVRLHDSVVYGERVPDAGRILQARAALRSMRRPGLWPARLRSLLFSSEAAPLGGGLWWMAGDQRPPGS